MGGWRLPPRLLPRAGFHYGDPGSPFLVGAPVHRAVSVLDSSWGLPGWEAGVSWAPESLWPSLLSPVVASLCGGRQWQLPLEGGWRQAGSHEGQGGPGVYTCDADRKLLFKAVGWGCPHLHPKRRNCTAERVCPARGPQPSSPGPGESPARRVEQPSSQAATTGKTHNPELGVSVK